MLIDSGDGVTHCIPVVDMAIITSQIGRMNLAGRHITNHLVKLMSMRGYAFNNTADFELIRELK
jgi:actin-related protein 2